MIEMSHGLTRGNAFLHEPEAHKSWGLPTCRAGKPIIVRFGKDEPYEINEMALHMTL
jgi:hypothetical protein